MRRTFLKPGATKSLAQALVQRQPRRMYGTPPTKKPTPPDPIEPSFEQAMPIGAYYEQIKKHPQPIPEKKPEEPPKSSTEDLPSAPPRKHLDDIKTKEGDGKQSQSTSAASGSPSEPPIPAPSEAEPTPEARARIVFGSALSGPAQRAERLEAIRSKSKMTAGVLVPPRPEEPDNCCMSGCVNCVWDRYRDEMEYWAVQSEKAQRRLLAQEAGVTAATTAASMDAVAPNDPADPLNRQPDIGATSAATSMDDDGGGSSSNWDIGNVAGQGAGATLTKNFWDDDLYKNVPVGIREFMKQEKRLKEKHLREGTLGG